MGPKMKWCNVKHIYCSCCARFHSCLWTGEDRRDGESLNLRKRQCKTVKLENIKSAGMKVSVWAGEENEPFYVGLTSLWKVGHFLHGSGGECGVHGAAWLGREPHCEIRSGSSSPKAGTSTANACNQRERLKSAFPVHFCVPRCIGDGSP